VIVREVVNGLMYISPPVVSGDHVRHVSVPDETLRRWRLSRPAVSPAMAKIIARLNVEIVKHSDHAKDLSSSRSAGWSNERSHGSGDVGVSPKIGRISTERRSHFCGLASIRLMLRKLCIPHDRSGTDS